MLGDIFLIVGLSLLGFMIYTLYRFYIAWRDYEDPLDVFDLDDDWEDDA